MDAAALPTDFAGTRRRVFWLALKTSVLTLLTLGIYRFWMKTRLRRFYWSAVRPGGLPLEYVGDPLEKVLGFLIAVCVLAFYIGMVNLILMFLSFALLNGNVAGYVLSFIGIVPIFFYARYRARRFVVSRTRWRGIRFGVEPGGWGYAWRAMVHWALTLLTLGLLWPRKTFWLEKYMTDRTSFGTVRLRQDGRWTMLIRPMLPLYLGAAGTVVAIGVAIALENGGPLLALPGTVPLLLFGLVYYRVRGWQRLVEAKSGGGMSLRAAPRPWRVLRIYLVGGLALGIVLSVILAALVIVLLLAIDGLADIDAFGSAEALMGLPNWATGALGVLLYFSFFLTLGVLRHVFFTLPLWRHYAETLTINGAEALPAVRQRDRDVFQDAEGFAEALDFGGGL